MNVGLDQPSADETARRVVLSTVGGESRRYRGYAAVLDPDVDRGIVGPGAQTSVPDDQVLTRVMSRAGKMPRASAVTLAFSPDCAASLII
jgi:hypothetical protein